MRKMCKNCGDPFDRPTKGRIKNCCSYRCSSAYWYKKNKVRARKYNSQWYLDHRESELVKNREYREQKRELFDWYHDKKRFDGVKEAILSRDNHECKACLSKEKLIVHHKDETGETSLKTKKLIDVKINNDINNLVTLCHPCHVRLHFWQKRSKVILDKNEQVIKLLKELNKNGKNSRYWRRALEN